MTQGQELVDALREVWRSITDVGATLSEVAFKTPTDCPGWSVQDNIAHLCAIESMLLGDPTPSNAPTGDLSHVKNEAGRFNEIWVDSRRSLTGAEVMAEFAVVTGRRIDALLGFSEADFDRESWTPMGPGTVRSLLPFRIFDSWAHEQDIRRAVTRPGGFDTQAAVMSMERMVDFMPYVVGKKVRPPDGTTVVWHITGSLPRTVAVTIADGRARTQDVAPADPTVSFTMSAETFARLALGRGVVAAVVAVDPVVVAGDRAVAQRILDSMNTLF